jgi:hypothetical protein
VPGSTVESVAPRPLCWSSSASNGVAALRLSVVVKLAALKIFGGIKGRFTGTPVLRSALQTTLIGGLAAAAAFRIASWIGQNCGILNSGERSVPDFPLLGVRADLANPPTQNQFLRMNHPMTIRLRDLIRRNPFHPFDVKMVDGQIYHVPHEDFLTVTRSGMVFYDDGETIHKTLNVTLILEIVDGTPAGA